MVSFNKIYNKIYNLVIDNYDYIMDKVIENKNGAMPVAPFATTIAF